MRKSLFAALLLGLGAFLIFANPTPKPLGTTPVVVELFTSQGCSSCPPADDLLSAISKDPAFKDKVIPLAFHVDYWNYLGWRDPFSAAQWSRRQSEYTTAMRLASAYTPQAVVNGEQQLVGSNRSALLDAIRAQSLRKPEATVRATAGDDGVTIDAETSRPLDALVLVVENGVPTRVERGENGGRTLTNDRIVRQLIEAGHMNRGTSRLHTAARASRDSDIVVILQDATTKRIYAATTAVRTPR